VFRIDRQPDIENLQYDSVYSGNVAVYRRKFDCLGLRSNQQLKWNDGRSKLNRKKKRLEVEARYFRGLEKADHGPVELAIPGKADKKSLSGDYIRITSNCSALKGRTSTNNLTAERHLSQMTGEYNRSLLEDPHNVSLWLEFLAFQDQQVEWDNLPGEVSAGHKQRALRERKIAILERALEQNPKSEDLLIGHMTLVQQTWPNEKLIRKWKDIVFVHPNRPRLWLGYIQFCQANFSSFGTSSLISLYRKCITTLSAVCRGTLQSHPPLPNTASYLLAIFSLFCHFLRQVGLTERAIACYQALVEFNLCTPPEFTNDDKSLMEFFETFWDSGCPRFGEVDAVGWMNWMKKNTGKTADVASLGVVPCAIFRRMAEEGEEVVPANQEDKDAELISGLPLAEAWLKLEGHRIVHNSLPWQPNLVLGQSEEDCSDPDRMVTYDDVSQTLFRVTDGDLKAKLLLAFLNFLGCPVGSPFQSLVQGTMNLESLHDISTPLFLRTMNESASMGATTRGLGTTDSLSSEKSLTDFANFVSSQLLSSSGPTSSATTPAYNFLCNVCNHSLSLLPSTEHQTQVATVWVSFLFQQLSNSLSQCPTTKKELKSEIRLIQKLFKALLRLEQHRNNLSLWDSYALLEYSVGNFQEARTLYQSLLTRHPVPSAVLCCTLCECFMGMRRSLWEGVELDTPLCLHALVSLSEGKNCPVTDSISPSRILKARSCFSQMIGSLSFNSWEDAGKAVCYGYFEYLTRGMKEACLVFGKFVDKLKVIIGMADCTETAQMCFLKEVYWREVQLVEYHSLHHPVQPALLRGVVQGALDIFPSEGRFMAVFVRNERQTFISGRMRRHFDLVAPTAESAVPWLLAVAAELDRYYHVTGHLRSQVEETSVGTMQRVRSLLVRAASSDNARHCPLLWRLYLTVQVSIPGANR
jgi:tetratricopeptide (TPR) repeat protein